MYLYLKAVFKRKYLKLAYYQVSSPIFYVIINVLIELIISLNFFLVIC